MLINENTNVYIVCTQMYDIARYISEMTDDVCTCITNLWYNSKDLM